MGFAECQVVRLPGSDRAKESGRAVSRLGVSWPLLTAPAALPDAPSATHRVVGSIEFRSLARCIDLLAGTRNGPTTIDRLHSRHDPSEIFGDGEITAHQFLQNS